MIAENFNLVNAKNITNDKKNLRTMMYLSFVEEEEGEKENLADKKIEGIEKEMEDFR